MQLQENEHQTRTKVSQRGAEESNRKQRAAAFLQRFEKEHEDYLGRCRLSQEESKRPPEIQEKYPPFGMVNLVNTCCLNAVCQVSYHCGAARNFYAAVLRCQTRLLQASPKKFPKACPENCRTSQRTSLTVFLVMCLASDAAPIVGHRGVIPKQNRKE